MIILFLIFLFPVLFCSHDSSKIFRNKANFPILKILLFYYEFLFVSEYAIPLFYLFKKSLGNLLKGKQSLLVPGTRNHYIMVKHS